MAEYLIDKAYLVALADAIRKKSGSSSKMTPSAMVSAINNLGEMAYTPPSSSGAINKTGELYTIQDTTFNSLAKAIRNKAGISDKMTPHKMIDVVSGLEEANKAAFAVYSADDNSLNFYKRAKVPKAGEQFEGKTATEVYTGNDNIETDKYTFAILVPWNKNKKNIQSVNIIDVIQPLSIEHWFNGFEQIKSINLNNIDTSLTVSMSDLFYNCNKLNNIVFNQWNTTSVKDIGGMFYGCSSMTSINIDHFKTPLVTNIGLLFGNCFNLKHISLKQMDTTNVTQASYAFSDCTKLETITIGNKFKWIRKGYLAAPSSSNISGADGKWYALSSRMGYTPENIPSNKADTYYASKNLLP